MTDADPVNPMRIFHELSARLPDGRDRLRRFRLVGELVCPPPRFRGGDARVRCRARWPRWAPQCPMLIGAKWAHPDRPAIAFVGDGAMQMNGMAELITVEHYWRAVADPRLIVAVLHNNDLNQVTWELRAMGGAPKFVASQTLPDVDYAEFARSLGLLRRSTSTIPSSSAQRGTRRWPPIAHGARRAVRSRRPADPAARHVRADQSVRECARRGGRRRLEPVVKQGTKQKVQQYLPGTK